VVDAATLWLPSEMRKALVVKAPLASSSAEQLCRGAGSLESRMRLPGDGRLAGNQSRKVMLAGLPTGVYWPVNVSRPVSR